MSDFLARLERFLSEQNEKLHVEQLTPDASTREYFRVGWKGGTAIGCVYPEPFIAAEQNYLDVTNLFRTAGLPVARVFEFDEALGVIIQEDLGDTILRDVLEHDEKGREILLDAAIVLIAGIQSATPLAYELDSIASRLKFDTEKLLWELEFFKTHYFSTYKGAPLSTTDDRALSAEFLELASELESKATVLCHRDFHAANIMVHGGLWIIDHQDARIGSVAYDLVSLLLDRVTQPPDAEWLANKRRFFLAERKRNRMDPIDENAFAEEFRLQTIQRCLKAIGTFSFQSVNRGKTYFVPFIKPMFEIVLRAAENLDRFHTIREIVKREIA
jgi:hypothetical protein